MSEQEVKRPAIPKHHSIEELMEICEQLLEIKNSTKLTEAAIEQNSIYFKVQRLLAEEAQALDYYMGEEVKLELHLRRYYEGKLPPAVYADRPLKYPVSTKAESDLCLRADPLYCEIKGACNKAKRRVEFLESVSWRIKERGAEIRTIMEWRRFTEGGV